MPLYEPPSFTLGRFLISLQSVLAAICPYIADFNETHVYNPSWPPHARFHNGQTMSMGLALGLLTLFLAFRPWFAPISSVTLPGMSSEIEDGDPKEGMAVSNAQLELERKDVLAAALVGSVYWVTGLTAQLYPGALAVDPEFGTGFPQLSGFIGLLVLVWVGWWMEETRLTNARVLIEVKTAKYD